MCKHFVFASIGQTHKSKRIALKKVTVKWPSVEGRTVVNVRAQNVNWDENEIQKNSNNNNNSTAANQMRTDRFLWLFICFSPFRFVCCNYISSFLPARCCSFVVQFTDVYICNIGRFCSSLSFFFHLHRRRHHLLRLLYSELHCCHDAVQLIHLPLIYVGALKSVCAVNTHHLISHDDFQRSS